MLNLGDILHRAVAYQESVSLLEQALVAQRRLASRHGDAAALVNLSDVLITLDRYKIALERLREASALFDDLGDRYGAGFVQHHHGRIHAAHGRTREAV